MDNENFEEEALRLAHLPDGTLNVPYLLSNALVLVNAGEISDAASLFNLVKAHPKHGHCGHYGLGLCLMKLSQPASAVRAFKNAYDISPRAYIGVAMVEAMIAANQFRDAETMSERFAIVHAQNSALVEVFRLQYRVAIQK